MLCVMLVVFLLVKLQLVGIVFRRYFLVCLLN